MASFQANIFRPNETRIAAISLMQDIELGGIMSIASLVFPRGSRPARQDVRTLASRDGQFAVSIEPEETGGAFGNGGGDWVELVANGLTFDLAGLAPGEGTAVPEVRHQFGLPPGFHASGMEAVQLIPGPHLAGGHMLLPVLRTHAWLAARLASLPHVQAVAWHTAGSWNSPEHFRSHVTRWIDGGAFPGLGLAALVPTPDGGIASEGLELFTGQEVVLAPELASDRVAGARIALRLMHWLVENGTLVEAEILTGPSGEQLLLEPSKNRRLVEVCKT